MDTICICGEAGSGKDTVADLLREQMGGVKMALADPMKRLVRTLMWFTDQQLWGPSETRGTVDEHLTPEFISQVVVRVLSHELTPEKQALNQLLTFVPDPGTTRSLFLAWLSSLAEMAEKSGPLSPRVVLQTLGTEFGRSVDPGLWIKIGLRNRELLLQGNCTYTAQGGVVKAPGVFINTVYITDCRFRNEVLAFNAMGATMIRVLTGEDRPKASHASEQEQRSIPDNWFQFVVMNRKRKGLEALKHLIRDLSRNARMNANTYDTEFWG